MEVLVRGNNIVDHCVKHKQFLKSLLVMLALYQIHTLVAMSVGNEKGELLEGDDGGRRQAIKKFKS